MSLPEPVINSALIICERLLRESDGVLSAIRMVDIFFVPPLPPNIPDKLHAVEMTVVAQVKLKDDGNDHSLALDLLRPSGDRATPVKSDPMRMRRHIPEIEVGGLVMATNIGVLIREFGIHYFILLFDGVEIARVPFTLLPAPQETTNQPQP